ncbi:MAG: hypothetical protein NTW21_15690 [Verrucomicrobia bacterium]|nr:hypothetical protein [Verrucomicrobiota bacterium]
MKSPTMPDCCHDPARPLVLEGSVAAFFPPFQPPSRKFFSSLCEPSFRSLMRATQESNSLAGGDGPGPIPVTASGSYTGAQRLINRQPTISHTFSKNMKLKTRPMQHTLAILAALVLQATTRAQPVVNDSSVSIHAFVTDPQGLSFAPDGTLYVGRDASGSGGGSADAVKIHRVAPGGSLVTEFGNVAIGDPDALIVDVTGAVSGTPGSVLVGGVHNSGTTGKITTIAPDGTVTTLFGPSASLWNPTDFAFDQSGRLLITEISNGKVLVSSGGTPTVLFSVNQAACIAVDALNRIAVDTTDSTQLRLYTSAGTLSNASFATVKAGSPIVRGPGGAWGTDLYAVAPNGDLIRIATDGTTTVVGHRFVMNSGANFPALAFGPEGALYVSDFQADSIYRFAPPVVPGTQTTIYARVTDPVRLSFAPDGTLFVGRDNYGSGGGNSDAVKIHRVGPGGSPVEEYGNTAITDPDAVYYDTTGQFSGTPGAVIVGGEQLNSEVGKLVKILPNGTITTIYGPTDFGFNPNVFVHDEIGGRLLISDSVGGRIWTMTNSTPAVLITLPLAFPLAVDSLGRIIVGANDSVLRLYSASGALVNGSYAQAQANTIIARSPGGFWGTDVYFVGTNWNLMRLDTNGVVSQVGTSFGGMSGFAFGPDGALYASQLDNDLIWRIAPVDECPRLTISRESNGIRATWASTTNRSYQLQSSSNLTIASWLNVGPSLPGTGGPLSMNVPIGPEPRKFFRLQVSGN